MVLNLISRSGHAEWYKMTPSYKKLRVHHPALLKVATVTITTVITIVTAI